MFVRCASVMQTDTAVHWSLSLFSSAGEGSRIHLVFCTEYLPADITVFIQWEACNNSQWNSNKSFHFISITGFAGPKDYSAFYSDITNCQPICTVIALSFHLLTSEKYDGAVEGKFELWNPLCIENVLWIHVFDRIISLQEKTQFCLVLYPSPSFLFPRLMFTSSLTSFVRRNQSRVYRSTNFIHTQQSVQ